MKKYTLALMIIGLLILRFNGKAQSAWKPTKNDAIVGLLQLVSGGADGLREHLLYHPNQLFQQHPDLNRQYWDSVYHGITPAGRHSQMLTMQ